MVKLQKRNNCARIALKYSFSKLYKNQENAEEFNNFVGFKRKIKLNKKKILHSEN